MKKSPFLSVVIPALNAEKTIGSLLVRIFDSKFRDFEVIVVDDASTDRTGQVIYEFCDPPSPRVRRGYGGARGGWVKRVFNKEVKTVRQWELGGIKFIYHRLSKRGGAARARNEGVRLAKGEIVLLFDSDVLPIDDMVSEVAEKFKKNARLISVTGFPGTVSENMGFGARYKYWRDYVYWHIENNANSFFHFRPAVGAIRRKIFWEAGGYDERYPGATMEDMEFSYRLAKFGKIVFDKNMVVAHPYGDLLDLVRTYFQRSYYYMELFLKRKQFTGVAMTGHEAYTIMAAVGMTLGILIWGIWGIWEIGVMLLIIFIYLQRKFLGLVLKKEGLWFTIKAILASYLLYIVICMGGARYLFSKVKSQKSKIKDFF